MNMFTLLDGRDYFPDVFAVLCDGVSNPEISQGNLVSEGYILERLEFERGPAVKGQASCGLRGMQIGDGHTNRITAIVHKEISHFHLSLSNLTASLRERRYYCVALAKFLPTSPVPTPSK
jgi:hypothetical protein